jgi:hypothetical protein
MTAVPEQRREAGLLGSPGNFQAKNAMVQNKTFLPKRYAGGIKCHWT